jgi:hypothetical protein
MGLEGAEPYVGTSPYVVPLQTLDFNEELRVQVIYDEAPPGEGGVAVDAYGALVPVSWRVVIKSTTRAGMIAAYNDLQAALLNPKGGVIEYKPEDLGAGVLSTFYHYVTSPPPRLVDAVGNRWDAAARSDGTFTLLVDVVFLTQPAATSDPDNPVTLADLSVTLQNWIDASPAQTNRVTVQGANLKGTLPALVRLLAQPGSGQGLGRLIVFRRTGGTLPNLVTVYEAEDAESIYPSVAWFEAADATRGGGKYLRCIPPAEENGVAQGLRFTIANPTDHGGRFAVFGVGRDESDETGLWTHQAKLVCGSVVQESNEPYSAGMTRTWQLVYVGEFELPPSPLSDSEGGYHETPYLDWYSTRGSGATEFWLDGLVLVYVGDERIQPTALDVPCDDEGGVDDTEKLLVENFPDEDGRRREIAHVVAAADGDLVRLPTSAPRGDFLLLPPGEDSLLVFVQERASEQTILDDDFTSYKGNRWTPLCDFESDEAWTAVCGTTAADTANEVEGCQARRTTSGVIEAPSLYGSRIEHDVALSLDEVGGFLDFDFVVLYHVVPSGMAAHIDYLSVRFETDASNYFYTSFPITADGKYMHSRAKETFLTVGNPDWGTITKIVLITANVFGDSTSVTDYKDDLRIEKQDPADYYSPDPKCNATGSQWDFQPRGGWWTVTEDVDGAGSTLACLDTESGVEKAALIDEATPNNVTFRARVMAKRDEGLVGILWRTGEDTLTEGAEDGYAALLDVANDQLLIREYSGGSVTLLGSPAFTCAVDTWYVVGVIAKDDNFRLYAAPAGSLSDDDDVFGDAYLLAVVEDATFAGGHCGVMSVGTLGRFDEVKLTSREDKVVPADTITLQGQAIFRTIAPFCE